MEKAADEEHDGIRKRKLQRRQARGMSSSVQLNGHVVVAEKKVREDRGFSRDSEEYEIAAGIVGAARAVARA